MTEGEFSRDDLLRARTVTLADGTEILFGHLDSEQYQAWEKLQSRELEDREYVVSLLAELCSEEQSSKPSFSEWNDGKILELVEKYLLKFDDGDSAKDVSTLLDARQKLDEYMQNELDDLTKLSQQAMKSFEKIHAPFTQIPDLAGC